MRIRQFAAASGLAIALIAAGAPLAAFADSTPTTPAQFGTVTSFNAGTGALVVGTTAGGSVSATVTDGTRVRLSTDEPHHGWGEHHGDGPGEDQGDRDGADPANVSSASASDDVTCAPAPTTTPTSASVARSSVVKAKGKKARAAALRSAKVRAAKIRAAKVRAAQLKAADEACMTPAEHRAAALAALVPGAGIQRLVLDPQTGELRAVVVVAAAVTPPVTPPAA